ncbi:MAG: GumC family protein [Desulfobaccales bacterium]
MEQLKDVRDVVAILSKRKKFFIIPFGILFILATTIAFLLPAIYESKTTILIEDQQIPPEFVRSTVTGFADQRIQSLTQQILSRTRLWEIVQQFQLYSEMQEKYTREEILEKMRDDIHLETISAEVGAGGQKQARPAQSAITIAFSISYRGKNPETVQKVAGNLASLYLEQNLKIREAQAKTTTQFLEAESRELGERIKVIGDKITTFKKEHEGNQPELQQFNQGQALRLEQETKEIDNQIRAAEGRQVYLEGQLATVKPETPVSPSGEKIMDPQTRLRALQISLADLQSKFSEDHPDIRKTKREMAGLEKLESSQGSSASQKREKLAQLKAELAEKQGKYSPEHPDIRKLKNEIARLEQQPDKSEPSKAVKNVPDNPAYITLTIQVETTRNEIAALQRQREALKDKLKMFNQRLEQGPKLEQEYFALQRDYTNSTAKYQEVMNKIMEARISEGMEEHQKGEKFTLIDPASFPQKPVKPNRWAIILAGFVLGFGAGVGAVAMAEQMDHSLNNADELASFTGFPVLGSITRIGITEDIISHRRKRRFIWTAIGLVLLLGLLLFHFLYMDLWVLTARLMRLLNKYT